MIPIRRYDPRQAGLARWFGCLEALMMRILWDAERPLTTQRIKRRMVEAGHCRSLSAIDATLARLQHASLVTRHPTHLATYSARWDEHAWIAAQERAIRGSL